MYMYCQSTTPVLATLLQSYSLFLHVSLEIFILMLPNYSMNVAFTPLFCCYNLLIPLFPTR